jgi:NAD(P)-dependent dehydrogenase (short-subunit alcohol dehydrogenase family)
MSKLSGKVAVVTGGNSGIGFATAKEFKEQGAKVAISGRSRVTEAAKEIGADVLGVTADVTKFADFSSMRVSQNWHPSRVPPKRILMKS